MNKPSQRDLGAEVMEKAPEPDREIGDSPTITPNPRSASLSRKIPKAWVFKLLKRAGHRCEFISPETQTRCSSKFALQVDHRQPLSMRGDTRYENLQVHQRVGKGPSRMSPNDLWHVIVFDGNDIGFWWIQCDPAKQEAFGYDIWIHPDFRGKGIGREVMLRGRAHLEERKIEKLRVCVFEKNSVARALYESLGFKETSFDRERKQYHLEISVAGTPG